MLSMLRSRNNYNYYVRQYDPHIVPRTVSTPEAHHSTSHTIHLHLITSHREQVMADLMKETEDVASKRKAYREMRDLLKSALDIVNEVSTVRVGALVLV